MKFILTLLGIMLLASFTFTPFVSSNYNISVALNAYNEPLLLLALATGVANLILGGYITVKTGYKKNAQLLACVFVIFSGILSIVKLFYPEFFISKNFVWISLLIGVVLHFLLNIRSLNPASDIIYDTSEREKGSVKWFNNSKGFGFITRDNGSDIFVHYRAIRGEGHKSLIEGQRVEFVISKKDKGLQAEDVIAALDE